MKRHRVAISYTGPTRETIPIRRPVPLEAAETRASGYLRNWIRNPEVKAALHRQNRERRGFPLVLPDEPAIEKYPPKVRLGAVITLTAICWMPVILLFWGMGWIQ